MGDDEEYLVMRLVLRRGRIEDEVALEQKIIEVVCPDHYTDPASDEEHDEKCLIEQAQVVTLKESQLLKEAMDNWLLVVHDAYVESLDGDERAVQQAILDLRHRLHARGTESLLQRRRQPPKPHQA